MKAGRRFLESNTSPKGCPAIWFYPRTGIKKFTFKRHKLMSGGEAAIFEVHVLVALGSSPDCDPITLASGQSNLKKHTRGDDLSTGNDPTQWDFMTLLSKQFVQAWNNWFVMKFNLKHLNLWHCSVQDERQMESRLYSFSYRVAWWSIFRGCQYIL